MKAMLGFVKRDIGDVYVFGKPVEQTRGMVAYVPQRGTVDWDYPVTVYDVAMMGRYGHIKWWKNASKEDHEIVERSLEMVRMSDFRHRQIGQLSGGQQQRVFMARALAQGLRFCFWTSLLPGWTPLRRAPFWMFWQRRRKPELRS